MSAYEEIHKKYLNHMKNMLMDIAEYIYEKFYGGDFQKVIDKNPERGSLLRSFYEQPEGEISIFPKKNLGCMPLLMYMPMGNELKTLIKIFSRRLENYYPLRMLRLHRSRIKF